jgi:hypothetical protein
MKKKGCLYCFSGFLVVKADLKTSSWLLSIAYTSLAVVVVVVVVVVGGCCCCCCRSSLVSCAEVFVLEFQMRIQDYS